MKALTAVLQRRPDQIGGAFAAVVNLLVILNVVHWDGAQVAAVNSTIGALLLVFLASTTTNVAGLNDLANTPPDTPPAGHLPA